MPTSTFPSATAPSTSDLLAPDFWRRLNPQLSLSADPPAVAARRFTPDQLDQVSRQLEEEGYLFLPPLLSAKEIARLRLGVERLVARDFPPAFAYLYDDYWQLFASLSPLLARFLGDRFRLLPNFWAWHVAPGEENSGWPATPENGCIYVLPLSREAHYDRPVEGPADLDLQDIRALPAQAGSVLGWRQDLFHWGARSTRRASQPRISLSLEFQNAAFDPLATPLLQADQPPGFTERLALILAQFDKYRHMERLTPAQQTLRDLLR